MRHKIIFLSCLLLAMATASCDDFLDITPTGKVIPTTGQEFRDLLTNAYKTMPSDRGMTSLRTDEVELPNLTAYAQGIAYYRNIWCWNDDAYDNETMEFNWRNYYHVLYMANYIIEHQGEVTDVKRDELDQMVGEAHMLRAYTHFTLVNLFAVPYTACADPAATRGVPLKMNSDVTEVIGHSTLQAVYDQVLSDIDAAAGLLNVDKWPKGETYRWNKLSANSLRARVLLYMGRYAEALAEAEKVVDEHPALQAMSGSLLPNHYTSDEAIVSGELVMTSDFVNDWWVNPDYLKLYRKGDHRKDKFVKQIITDRYMTLKAGKLKESDTRWVLADDATAFRCTFRSAEFYLIAAECAMRTADRTKALAYYEALIDKRYKSGYPAGVKATVEAMTDDELLSDILDERAREFIFEGHRWFDLRRTTRPALTKTYRGETFTLMHDDPRYTLPIPSEALTANPLLAD